jgi:hypothetical protein
MTTGLSDHNTHFAWAPRSPAAAGPSAKRADPIPATKAQETTAFFMKSRRDTCLDPFLLLWVIISVLFPKIVCSHWRG